MSNQSQKDMSRANRGKGFESEIAAANGFYLLRGKIDVVQNLNAFDFATGQNYWRYKKLYEQGDARAARSGDGKILMRVYSEVDFSGGNFTFDAKETNEKSFSLEKVTSRQVKRLLQSATCGSTSGIFVKLVALNRCFFVPAVYLDARYTDWQKKKAAAGRAPKGSASISLPEMERQGTEIFRDKVNRLWDWLGALKGK